MSSPKHARTYRYIIGTKGAVSAHVLSSSLSYALCWTGTRSRVTFGSVRLTSDPSHIVLENRTVMYIANRKSIQGRKWLTNHPVVRLLHKTCDGAYDDELSDTERFLHVGPSSRTSRLRHLPNRYFLLIDHR